MKNLSIVSADQVAEAQRIIAGVKDADEVKQNKVIEKIIQFLYFYSFCENQHDALQQLIYKRKDLILIAKT